jgi:hypothetical protein
MSRVLGIFCAVIEADVPGKVRERSLIFAASAPESHGPSRVRLQAKAALSVGDFLHAHARNSALLRPAPRAQFAPN